MRRDRRMMKKMMKKAKTEPIEGALEVIIRLMSGDEIVISNPQVVRVRMGPQEIFQITGASVTLQKSTPAEALDTATVSSDEEEIVEIPEEDIKLVAQQTGVSMEEAHRALEEAKGEPAKAILALRSKKD
ncbi:MAG: nascent polypeptide-associated complex protein [Candidatus Wukongarchaeota archaeon]|nr:nascent polypeptide-associated complex protein [Candidatus Wukongarchaeota archaeon]MDO8128018.1 nascent polypeptide-associated complex protein [Candidatus Wukongarchaeota archaeon]